MMAAPLPDRERGHEGSPEGLAAERVTDRQGSWLQTVRAVAWSFLGIRRRAGYAEDVAKLNPIHVVVAGVIGAALFVVALLLLVRWIISSGVAT